MLGGVILESKAFKVIRGYYLIAVGQEAFAHYFKIPEDHANFEGIVTGDIALTFYQNDGNITSIPALIRIDGVIESQKMVKDYLQREAKDGFPMLPIVHVLEKSQFDPLMYRQMTNEFQKLKKEMERLATARYVQGTIFDYLEEEK